MANNERKIMAKTPVGTAIYPHLLDVDKYQLDNHGKQEYNTQLRLSPSPERDTFQALIDSTAAEALAECVATLSSGDGKSKALAKSMETHVPYTFAVDDDGDDTDDIVFKFKCAAGGTDKNGKDWEKELPVFDSLGQPLKGEARKAIRLWGGSRISVAAQVMPFAATGLKKAGVSLRLQAVQIIEAKGGSENADVFGFGVVEGGFKAESFAAHAVTPTPEVEDEYVDDIPF